MRTLLATCLAVLPVALAVGSCALFETEPHGPTAAFAERRPRTIYVFEPSALSGQSGGVDSVRERIEKCLERKGYRVGWPADATLYAKVKRWGEQRSMVGSSRAQVSLSATLVEGSDGVELWRGDGHALEERDEDDEKGGVLGSLFDSAVENATERFTGDRQEVVEEAVYELVASLPDAPDDSP